MDELRSVSLFAELPDEDLAKLAAGMTNLTVAAGEELFAEGDSGDRAFVITSGELEIVKVSGEREVRLAVSGAGDVVGEMALLDGAPRMASARALSDVELLAIPKANLDDLLATSATAVRALFAVFLERWRESQGRLRQSERMAQLGVLTAGLAHEMNNPAAAVRRGATQLQEAVARLEAANGALEPGSISFDDVVTDRAAAALLSPLDRADREAAVETLIDAAGVERAWELAPLLVEAGVERQSLQEVIAAAGATGVTAVAADAEVRSLLAEVEEGARRLSDLVGALKSYSYLDQAPVQDVDVVKGIEDTLLILKAKTRDIEILREYADGLTPITAFGSQLNQVWTNLIDNASDAIASSGREDGVIVLRARPGEDQIVVEVEDNGGGIPPEALDRVFEAFYTTKPPGKGTGLGLDTVYSIVVNQHRGSVSVESEPGRTTFIVELPTSLAPTAS